MEARVEVPSAIVLWANTMVNTVASWLPAKRVSYTSPQPATACVLFSVDAINTRSPMHKLWPTGSVLGAAILRGCRPGFVGERPLHYRRDCYQIDVSRSPRGHGSLT